MLMTKNDANQTDEKIEDEWDLENSGENKNESKIPTFLFSTEKENVPSAVNQPVEFNHSREGLKIQDVVHWEKEVKEMMENVRSIHKKLSDGKSLDELFSFPVLKEESSKFHTDEDSLKNCIQDIEKMDILIKMKSNEEKQAKLSRIQEEEESRKILDELTNSSVSNAVKINSQKFLELLNDMEATECDEEKTGEEDEEEKAKKSKKPEISTSQMSFIERNIELAKCGRGTLSLTKEEELRIKNLLKEVEDSSGIKISKEKTKDVTDPNIYNYALDDESKSMLNEIDEKLEEYAKLKSVEESSSKLSLIKPPENSVEETICEENEAVSNVNKKKRKRKGNRLLEINKLLAHINSVSSDEINPLAEEDIEFLLSQARQSLGLSASEDEPNFLASETVAELVLNAKTLMPKFKFRFEEL